jgi:putative endonuclease
MNQKKFHIYITTNKINSVLYIGVTSNLEKRIYEHKLKIREGFTEKYNVNKLVYYEEFDDIGMAIQREKRLKKWNRDWKIKLIEDFNPEWKDLIDR